MILNAGRTILWALFFSVFVLVFLTVSAMAQQGQRPPRPSHQPEGPAAPSPPPPPPGATHGISIPAQLMITDLRVVEDPVRTDPSNGNRATWTFKYLMENLAGDNDPSEFALHWLELWEQDQQVNDSVTPARASMRELVIDPWLAASGGQKLDLTRAPFKLLAIVNRMDLRVHKGRHVATGGEGRFVFGVLGADGKPLPPTAGTVPGGFTVIFEFELTAKNMDQLRNWAMAWKRLDKYGLGSPEYKVELERITRVFSKKGRAPHKPNGSPLNQVRTNEVALGAIWELREFVIDPTTGLLRQHTVAQNPSELLLNGTPALARLINRNEAKILSNDFVVPMEVLGADALSGPFQESDFSDFDDRTFTAIPFFADFYDIPWSAAGVRNNDARHLFALNTCSGCHRTETGANFLQVGFPDNHLLPQSLGAPAQLAGFLTGSNIPDSVDATTTRHFADLERRKQDLKKLLDSFGSDGKGTGPRERHIPRFVH